MKFVHTGDWHLGKSLKGEYRIQDFKNALNELKNYLIFHKIPLLIVAGDIFDKKHPPPFAEKLAYDFFYEISKHSIRSVIISGNHDCSDKFYAIKDLLKLAQVIVVSTFQDPDIFIELEIENQKINIVAIPFILENQLMSLEEIVGKTPQKTFAKCLLQFVKEKTKKFENHTINIVVTHGSIEGCKLDGGERTLHSGVNQTLSPDFFQQSSNNIDYVALGHIHKYQQVYASPPTFFSGSLFSLNFGESTDIKGFLEVSISSQKQIETNFVPITSVNKLLELQGTVSELLKIPWEENYWYKIIGIDLEFSDFKLLRNHFKTVLEIRSCFSESHKEHLNEKVKISLQNANDIGGWISAQYKQYLTSLGRDTDDLFIHKTKWVEDTVRELICNK